MLGFVVALISEFAKHFGIRPRQAYLDEQVLQDKRNNMNQKLLLLMTAIILGIPSAMASHNQNDVKDDYWKTFKCDLFVDGMAFNHLSREECTVGVTYMSPSEMDADRWIYEADTLEIPSKITSDGIEYTVTAILQNAFTYSRIKHLVIPETVTEIKDQAFRDVYLLEELVIPNSVKIIGDYTFCGALNGYGMGGEYPKKVVFPGSIESWGTGIFSWRTDMPDIQFPEGMKTIPAKTFEGSYAKKWIQLPQSIEVIETQAFRVNFFEEITLPEHLTDIQSEAFSQCPYLKSVTIPASVTHIGIMAFSRDPTGSPWAPVPQECTLDTLRILSLPFDCELEFTKTVIIVPASTKEMFRKSWKVSPETEIKEDPNVVVDLTAITEVNNSQARSSNDACYDLKGQQLKTAPQKSIYIRNGKKYFFLNK